MTDIDAGSPSTVPGTHLAEIVFPEQLNHHGTYFGGSALALMSRSALVATTRIAHSEVVLARCHDVDFHTPVLVGEFVEATANVERIGKRSMTVSVTSEGLQTGERRAVVYGRFEMVALAKGATAHESGEAA